MHGQSSHRWCHVADFDTGQRPSPRLRPCILLEQASVAALGRRRLVHRRTSSGSKLGPAFGVHTSKPTVFTSVCNARVLGRRFERANPLYISESSVRRCVKERRNRTPAGTAWDTGGRPRKSQGVISQDNQLARTSFSYSVAVLSIAPVSVLGG